MSKKVIKIKPSGVADTRTCDWTKVTKEELKENTQQHIDDVRKYIVKNKDKITIGRY